MNLVFGVGFMGGVLADVCTIGAGLSGVGMRSIAAMLALASIVIGAVLKSGSAEAAGVRQGKLGSRGISREAVGACGVLAAAI